jgi:hypothetical protein
MGNSGRHPKESAINLFITDFQIEHRRNPNAAEIITKFGLDIESLAIGAELLDLPGKEDFIDRVRKVENSLIPDLIERYDGYPKWFSLFVPQSLYTAWMIWKTNRDAHKSGARIIDEYIESPDYVGEVKKIEESLSERIEIEMSQVPFNKKFIEVVESNLSTSQNIKFLNSEQVDPYLYFRLGDFFAFKDLHAQEISNYIQNAPEPRPNEIGHIFLSGKLGKKLIYYKIDLKAFLELWVKFDHKKIELKKKEIANLINEDLEDQGIVLGIKTVAFMVSVLKPEIGIVLKTIESSFESVPKVIKYLRTLELYPYEKLYQERLNLFEESGYDTVEKFYIENLKSVMAKLLEPEQLSSEHLDSDFYQAQYRNFINEYKNRKGLMSDEDLDLLEKYDDENKETLIFQLVSEKIAKKKAFKSF